MERNTNKMTDKIRNNLKDKPPPDFKKIGLELEKLCDDTECFFSRLREQRHNEI